MPNISLESLFRAKNGKSRSSVAFASGALYCLFSLLVSRSGIHSFFFLCHAPIPNLERSNTGRAPNLTSIQLLMDYRPGFSFRSGV